MFICSKYTKRNISEAYLNIGSNCWGSLYNLVHEELIENRGLASVIKTNQTYFVLWGRGGIIKDYVFSHPPSFPNRLQSLANIRPILVVFEDPLLSLPGLLSWPLPPSPEYSSARPNFSRTRHHAPPLTPTGSTRPQLSSDEIDWFSKGDRVGGETPSRILL